ncbi:MAG: glycoside hydrolase family 99-like domain-containing protein [Clostridia bacterium]|nr:glycoside hydrolase family 99-like domain-containing protein [Clostridia bacterium]
MKKTTLVKLLCILVAVFTLATVASAAGFTKTNSYADGTFSDVKSTSWYAKEVASAYELGFMNGKGEGTFAPDGNVTVAEAITMAARVHAIYNGKEIAKTEGKWYDMYVQYALANGIIAEGQYTNYDRNIMRYEMAVMFADSMPSSYFAAKNDVKTIPDVDPAEEYHDKLMMLYKAGVVMGSTEYGDFLATNSIKRSETAAIINRVALPENRQQKTLKEYGDRDQAVFLIDDYEMTRMVNGVKKLNSAYTFENTGNFNIDTTDSSNNGLADDSDTSFVAMHRNVTVQNKGVVYFDTAFTVSGDNGAKIYFSDSEGNILFELYQKNKKFIAKGDSEVDTGAAVADSNTLYAELDLDAKKALVVHNGIEIGTFDMSSKAKDIARVSFSTSKEYKSLFAIKEVHMYVNYNVYDTFRTDIAGTVPYGWETEGDVKISTMNSDKDVNSVTITGKGTAKKSFDAISDKFVLETFVFAPAGQSGSVMYKSGDTVAVKVDMKDGKLTSDGKELRSYHTNVWQLIRVEADTEKNTALIKINGKNTITVPFTVDSVDNIEITSESTGDFWFDDVEVYNVYDYADYCPTPVPVNNDDYYVGMSVCSLWREGSHYGWDCVSPYEEITPVLGYYDEGLPEVADWETKMLVEHGFDFQHYCWYLGNGASIIKEPRLTDAALHDGYFNSKYSNMIDFMIMWENNANANCKNFNDFMNIWNYWCDWYFSDSRYFAINNKPVLTIYRYQKFIECFGSEAEAKKAIDFMKEDIKKLGYDGMIILMCDRGNDAAQNKKFANIGADAMVAYTFGEASYDAQYQKDAMEAALKAGSLPFLPSVGVGFNDLGWTEIRTPLATAETHKEVYQWAKDTYLPKVGAKYKSQDWFDNFVFATTWNEFGEGHYILPTNVCGFGYLDGTRATFSSVAGTDDKAHFDVEPTITQKKRLGYLYPATTVPMRKQSLDEEGSNVANNKPVIEWNFEDEADCMYWTTMMNTSAPKYDAERKALVGTTTTNDAAIRTLDIEENYFDASLAKHLLITLDTKGKAVSGNMFFRHNSADNWSGSKGFNFSAAAIDGYQNVVVDLSSNVNWKDEIQGLRFDPNDIANEEYVIKRIAFLSDMSEGSVVLTVDKTPHVLSAKQVKRVGNDVYVAGNPSDGFYSIHNLYYEYNRVNGTLMIKSDNGKKMNLVVGSDVAVINGKEKKLSAKIDIYDGLVFVPLKEIYDMAGFKYSVDKDGNFTVSVRPEDIVNAATERVLNEFEFNVAGDTENWVAKCSTGNVANGVFGFTATPVDSTHTGFDPQIQISGARVDTKYYKNMEVRFRISLADESAKPDESKVYFDTDKEPGLAENKTVSFDVNEYEPDAQGFYTVNLDMTVNESWNGIVNTIRFDPANFEGYYEVDYIRFYADEKYKEELKKLQEEEKKKAELRKAADNGGPFYLENADAEDLGAELSTLAVTTKLTIVEDDLRKGNHAYLLTPNMDKQTWSYFVVPTRYKAGVTYKVDFDLRLVSDHIGEPVETKVVVNPRYTEKSDGAIKENVDHPENGQAIALSSKDGWVKASVTFTVKADSPLRTSDRFTIFANPLGDANEFKNIVYMVDNFVITVVEPEKTEETAE